MSDSLTPFIVYAPYRAEDDAAEGRSSFRSEHAAGIAKLKGSGSLQQVIMHLKPPSVANLGAKTEMADGTGKPEFRAATLILKAGSYLEAQNIIQSDVYWKENVWDKEQLVISPALIVYQQDL